MKILIYTNQFLENKDKMTKDFTDRFLVETKKDYNAL